MNFENFCGCSVWMYSCGSFRFGNKHSAVHNEPQMWYNYRVVSRKEVVYDVNR